MKRKTIKSALMDYCEYQCKNTEFTWSLLHTFLVIESLTRQGRFNDIRSFIENPKKWRGYMNCALSNYPGQGYCLRPSKNESRYLKKLDNGHYILIDAATEKPIKKTSSKRKVMPHFCVIAQQYTKEFEPYDIMPNLVMWYNHLKPAKRPKTIKEMREFVKKECLYSYWAKCEWEMIISDWPPSGYEEKWDVYKQIMMNIDLITELLFDYVNS